MRVADFCCLCPPVSWEPAWHDAIFWGVAWVSSKIFIFISVFFEKTMRLPTDPSFMRQLLRSPMCQRVVQRRSLCNGADGGRGVETVLGMVSNILRMCGRSLSADRTIYAMTTAILRRKGMSNSFSLACTMALTQYAVLAHDWCQIHPSRLLHRAPLFRN